MASSRQLSTATTTPLGQAFASTPNSKFGQPRTPVQSQSPGHWRHPNLTEIARRQKAVTFSESNVRRAFYNGGALAATWLVPHFAQSYLPFHHVVPQFLHRLMGGHDYLPLLLMRLLFLFNIVFASLPLARSQDHLVDIALTPSQRSLLGLDPNATPPATPGTHYSTPPRYTRSAVSRGGTPDSRNSSVAGSPLSRKEAFKLTRQSGDSFSPAASPLWQKTAPGSENRRHSYGFPPSPARSPAKDVSVLGLPGTPSPSGRGASVTLNSRWLFEKGRSSSFNRSLYS